MKIGRLTRRIEILGNVDVKDEYGFNKQEERVVARCWASIEPARGKTYYDMERTADTEYTVITIRWRKGLTHGMRVRYQDHVYDIDSIVDPSMRHERLELYCSEAIRGINV